MVCWIRAKQHVLMLTDFFSFLPLNNAFILGRDVEVCFTCASCGWQSVLGGLPDLSECTSPSWYVVITHSALLSLLYTSTVC